MKTRSLVAALVGTTVLAGTAGAGTVVLYDADPDSNAATAAPDPTTVGWGTARANGGTPGAGWGTAGTTTGGAQAWVINDAGATGTSAPNQGGSLFFDIDAATIELLDGSDFTLTMAFEQIGTGGFYGVGYNNEAGDTDFGLSASTRFGGTPSTGVQTLVYAWDGTTLTTANSGGGNSSTLWIGAEDGGARIFFGDNTVNSAAFNLAITSVTLESSAIPEPGSLALLGLGGLAMLRRRRA